VGPKGGQSLLLFIVTILDHHGPISDRGSNFFSSSLDPEWLWGPPTFLCNLKIEQVELIQHLRVGLVQSVKATSC